MNITPPPDNSNVIALNPARIEDAIGLAEANHRAITPEKQYWISGREQGITGALVPKFLTFYSNLFVEVGVQIKWIGANDDDRPALKKIEDWTSKELLPAIRDARIAMLRSGWGAVLIVPEVDRSTPEYLEQWAIERICTATDDDIDELNPEYLIQCELIKGMGIAKPAPLKKMQELIAAYDKKGDMINDLIRTISLLVIQEPGWNELLTKAFIEGDQRILELVKKKMADYNEARSMGLMLADAAATVSIETRSLSGLVELREEDRHRITAEADGIPEDILWNRSTKSGGLNTTDTAGLRVDEQLRSIFGQYKADLEKWIAKQVEAFGLNEVTFELQRGVYKVESVAERSERQSKDSDRRSKDAATLLSLFDAGVLSSIEVEGVARKILMEIDNG